MSYRSWYVTGEGEIQTSGWGTITVMKVKAPSTCMYPLSFEIAIFSLQIGLPSTCIRWKRSPKTHSRVEIFGNAFFVFLCGRWKRNFSKTLTSQCWIKPTPREIRAKDKPKRKMVDRRIAFVSLLLALISSLIACLQLNVVLLKVQSDYARSLT